MRNITLNYNEGGMVAKDSTVYISNSNVSLFLSYYLSFFKHEYYDTIQDMPQLFPRN